ncbi:hypothetical protein [Bacillus mesophilum]|uniref:Uncharacterized protein n=1 Tax=Bacillus mesophilum TaxID=1071718 RepID=A0A7V7RJU5_9BACI|nr:hypothetical protein [Bacillus mesophilum]KAB2331252.1 hypothetical protein F7732_15460 [Bacillus mesophilum]
MKPHQKNRNLAYYRRHRNRVIRRKTKFVNQIGWQPRHHGYFAKGKIHCSCGMCAQKTNKHGFPHSQKVQLERLESQLSEYFREADE